MYDSEQAKQDESRKGRSGRSSADNDARVTEALNQVYSGTPSETDPAAQAASIRILMHVALDELSSGSAPEGNRSVLPESHTRFDAPG
jgi:hypothetical protein